MSLHLGRIVLPEPTSWADIHGSIEVVGNYKATSVTDGMVKRDQILSLANNWDEPIIPVIMDGESRTTGYYRVMSSSFTTDSFTRLQGNLYDYQINLERVMGFTQPIIESILTDGLLTNVVGALIANHWPFHAYPAQATEYVPVNGLLSSTRSSADGTLNLAGYNSVTVTAMTGNARFALSPANFYIGACTIEQGSPLQPVVGRALQPDLVNWRLSNGLVRVTPNATTGKIDVSHWKGAAWATAKTYKITGTAGFFGLINGWTAITVMRNSVEECILRLTATCASSNIPVTLDISLRRGDRMAQIYLSHSSVQTEKWSVFRDTAEAATAITYGAVTLGGFRATANDGDGNRYVLLSYQTANTSDLVNGGLTQTGFQSTMDIGIGSEIAGSGAATIDTATAIAEQYIAAQGESQHIVAR